MSNPFNDFLIQTREAIGGTLSWLGTSNVFYAETINKFNWKGTAYGVVLVPSKVPEDQRGIGRWYRRFYACEVCCLIKSGLPQGTRIVGGSTSTTGIGSFVDTVRDVLRNNRLYSGGTYFLDADLNTGLGPVTWLSEPADNTAGAFFEWSGRKLFNDS